MLFDIFYSLIYLLNFLCSVSFLLANHPLAIGLSLLIQTILIVLLTGILIKTFWFSYILFLIFLGGILVLFIYVISIASNEIFSFSIKISGFFLIIIINSTIIFLLLDKSIINNYLKNHEISPLINQAIYILENNLILNKLYNFPANLITTILIIYLFLTLIAAVKITNNYEGPLRPKF